MKARLDHKAIAPSVWNIHPVIFSTDGRMSCETSAFILRLAEMTWQQDITKGELNLVLSFSISLMIVNHLHQCISL